MTSRYPIRDPVVSVSMKQRSRSRRMTSGIDTRRLREHLIVLVAVVLERPRGSRRIYHPCIWRRILGALHVQRHQDSDSINSVITESNTLRCQANVVASRGRIDHGCCNEVSFGILLSVAGTE